MRFKYLGAVAFVAALSWALPAGAQTAWQGGTFINNQQLRAFDLNQNNAWLLSQSVSSGSINGLFASPPVGVGSLAPTSGAFTTLTVTNDATVGGALGVTGALTPSGGVTSIGGAVFSLINSSGSPQIKFNAAAPFQGISFTSGSGMSLTVTNFLDLTGGSGIRLNSPVIVNGATGVTSAGDVNITGAFKVNGVALAPPPLSATSASIGGGALLAGACASTATTVTGAAVGMAAVATPNTYPGDGNIWLAYPSAANTVTVKVCAVVAMTPTASTYNLRIFQ